MSIEQIIFHSLTDELGKMYMDASILERDPINLWGIPVLENKYLPENTMMCVCGDFVKFVKIDGNRLKFWDVAREKMELKLCKWEPLEPTNNDNDNQFKFIGNNLINKITDQLRPLS
ncbi:MAG TPA: hypothetical protein ENH74_11280 [Methylophaga sp.]|uniref:Uncharacterized protein n=1 Tax=Pricia antarctica TaxID=641691 RepID=A0A831VTL8_9FLAO|nr:hypothetical protein [Methylophaga sp.]HEA19639.1 hypothetical protein [Pricia antarctica]